MRHKSGLGSSRHRGTAGAKPPAAGVLPMAPTHGSAGIAAQLRRAISDNIYAYGDKLPPEREIARSLGASRTTVRKALRQLEERNFVRRKIGSGTFVVYGRSSHDERAIAEITSPLELIDVRLAVEPHVIQLAVLHGTARDMEAIAEALAPLERAGADREHFTQWDQRFHMALANATHNPLMVWIYRQINEVRGHTQWSKAKDKVLTPARIADYNAQHRALFEAVQARDAEAALELITRHLAEARRDLVRAPST
ncbi:MAG: FadR/GntR family transcriptional regulator [Betaproteobacteria bacterium]